MSDFRSKLKALISKTTSLSSDQQNDVVDQVLKRVGETKDPRFIGKGMSGEVFWLKKQANKVLKVTKDAQDANAMQLAKLRPKKHLVHVYDVFEIIPKKLYGIVTEKLSDLSARDSLAWTKLWELIYFRDDMYPVHQKLLSSGLTPDFPDFLDNHIDALIEKREEAQWDADEEGTYFDEEDDYDDDEGTYDLHTPPYPILEALENFGKDLKSLGINFHDANPDNVMMRGRTYVLVDLGNSNSPRVRIPNMMKVGGRILEARKMQPLDGEFVVKKLRQMIKDFFLTEQMYEKVDDYWKAALPSFKEWVRMNSQAVDDGSHYSESDNLVTTYTGGFLLPNEVFPPFLKIVEQKLKGWGWYALTAKPPKGNSGMSFMIAPNYGDLVEDVPPKLYHLTLKGYLPSIRRKGILPQKGREHGVTRRGYPDRIYFAKSMNIVHDLHDGFLSRNYEDEGKYAVLTIDTHKLRRGTKFYSDPEMPHGYSMWTYTHVPREAILEVRDVMTEEAI